MHFGKYDNYEDHKEDNHIKSMATAQNIVIEKLRNHITEIDTDMQKHFKLNKQNLDT
jgi:hypothetical protein